MLMAVENERERERERDARTLLLLSLVVVVVVERELRGCCRCHWWSGGEGEKLGDGGQWCW